MAVVNGNGQKRPTNAQNQATVGPSAFARSSFQRTEQGEQRTVTLGATQQNVPLRVPVNGYLRTTNLTVTVESTGNSADVALQADAPFSLLKNVVFRDANSTPIYSNLEGYEVYLTQVFGGYRAYPNIVDLPSYQAPTTGTGATAGSFRFRMPLEHMFSRELLGLLANMDSSAQYNVDLVVSDLASIYSTAPNGTVNCTIQIGIDNIASAFVQDGSGATMTQMPPSMGSVQYWTKSVYDLTAGGENTIQLTRVGNVVRNYILIMRNSSGARATLLNDTDRIIVEYDAGQWYNEPLIQRWDYAYKAYGSDYSVTGNALGVLLYPFTLDPEGRPGFEFGDDYKSTNSGTKLQWRITPTANGQLIVLTNDIILRGQVVAPA